MSGGPILFAYDGSDLAARAIGIAADLLAPSDGALVLCVWEPFDVGFEPVAPSSFNFDAEQAPAVQAAAQGTADAGAKLAADAGFTGARGIAVRAAPTWRGIVDAAEEHDARVIVLGSHGRSGIKSMIVGSVAAAVSSHSGRSILITHAGA